MHCTLLICDCCLLPYGPRLRAGTTRTTRKTCLRHCRNSYSPVRSRLDADRTKQNQAAPSSNKQHQATPSNTKQHRAPSSSACLRSHVVHHALADARSRRRSPRCFRSAHTTALRPLGRHTCGACHTCHVRSRIRSPRARTCHYLIATRPIL